MRVCANLEPNCRAYELSGMRRRTYLRGTVFSALALSGCSTPGFSEGTTTTTEIPDTDSLTDWTATTDCDAMHESIIKVEWVRADLADDHAPIEFEDLSTGEQDILEVVLTEGGYATCDHSEAFRRFVDRVMTHRDQQPQFMVHLHYQAEYYGLYVQQGDQVFSGN